MNTRSITEKWGTKEKTLGRGEEVYYRGRGREEGEITQRMLKRHKKIFMFTEECICNKY